LRFERGGVVDQRSDAAEFGIGLVEERDHVGFHADVRLNGNGSAALGRDAVDHLFRAVPALQVADAHRLALCGGESRGGRADSARASRYDDDRRLTHEFSNISRLKFWCSVLTIVPLPRPSCITRHYARPEAS